MTTVGNIGIGLFILIIIWLLALIIFVISVKFESNIGWVAVGTALFVSIVLIVIPTEKRNVIEPIDNTEKDYGYIYRNILLAFLLLSVVFGFLSFFVLHCLEPVRVKPIKTFR